MPPNRRGHKDDPDRLKLILPYDAIILSKLPKEGALFAGYHPHALQVHTLAKAMTDESGTKITGSSIAGRMGTLSAKGFVVSVRVQPLGKGQGWQRTPAGDEFLRSEGYEID